MGIPSAAIPTRTRPPRHAVCRAFRLGRASRASLPQRPSAPRSHHLSPDENCPGDKKGTPHRSRSLGSSPEVRIDSVYTPNVVRSLVCPQAS